MKEEKQTLIRLHPNPPAGLVYQHRDEAVGAQLQAWEEAFQGWLDGYDNPETRKRMAKPVQNCLRFSSMPVWDVTDELIKRYLEEELGDKSTNTQYFHLKAIRSFYRYALNSPTGRDLKIEDNPGEAVRFPTPGLFLKARALSEEQVRKLFAVIDRDTPIGSRDYALYVTVMGSGIKGSQALRLRLGDIVRQGEKAWIVKREGKQNKRRWLPWCACEAIRTSLRTSGENRGVHAEEYVFRPLQDLSGILKKRRGEAWNKKPLSVEKAADYLKRYAEWAEMPGGKVTLECLRCTGALLRWKEGANLEELADFLGLANGYQARWMINKLRQQNAAKGWFEGAKEHSGKANNMEARVERVLKEILPPDGQSGQSKRRKKGGQQSKFALLVGEVMSKSVSVEEVEEARTIQGIEEEIALLRVLIRRVFDVMPEEPTAKEAVRFARLLSNLVSKVTTMVKTSPNLKGGENEHIKALLELNLEDETASAKSVTSRAQE
jgi:site-specific recombinase XerD